MLLAAVLLVAGIVSSQASFFRTESIDSLSSAWGHHPRNKKPNEAPKYSEELEVKNSLDKNNCSLDTLFNRFLNIIAKLQLADHIKDITSIGEKLDSVLDICMAMQMEKCANGFSAIAHQGSVLVPVMKSALEEAMKSMKTLGHDALVCFKNTNFSSPKLLFLGDRALN